MSRSAAPAPSRRFPWPRSPRRVALAALGVLCVVLAFAGAVLPGLPTTIFLIAASYLFTRSCPVLEERLIRNRWFRAYLPYLDGRAGMPRRARWSALALMWICVAGSLAATALSGRMSAGLAATIVSLAVVGSVVILRLPGPAEPSSPAQPAPPPPR